MFRYLTELRMQRARELLHETLLPLFDIASQVGYESDMAFAKAFKRNTGTTPAKYRRNMLVPQEQPFSENMLSSHTVAR